MILRLSVKIKG